MKHIGIIGGLSPESTIEYYRIICREFNKKEGKLNFPQITIRSLNLQELLGSFGKNRWDEVAEKIGSAICDLEKAGAEFVAIAANTPHNAYDIIQQRSPIKVLSIMEATADSIRQARLKKVGLLGTKATMEYGFFQKAFQGRGIDTVVPEAAQRNYIDRTIWDKLSHGEITREDRQKHKAIIKKLVNDGAEGVILGCTELPSLIKPEHSDVPLFDTTHIHALTVLEYAMGKTEKTSQGGCDGRTKNNVFLRA